MIASLILKVKKSFTTRSVVVDKQTYAFTPYQAIALVILYFVGVPLVGPIGQYLTHILYGSTSGIHQHVALGLYVCLFLIFFGLVYTPMIASFKFFKKNLKHNLIEVLKTWGLMLIATILVGIVFNFILPKNSQSGNQAVVESAFWNAPLFMTFNIILYAPIVEEIVFRGVFYQTFRSRFVFWPAVLISTLVFGGLHVIQPIMQGGSWTEIIYLFQYAFMAFFMINAYEKTGSIWGAIMIHFLNNFLSLLQFTL